MAFSFVHMADVHLDTPFLSKDSAFRCFMRDSIRQAFRNGVDLALEKKVHALLIAGDLFDNDTLSFNTEKFLLEQMNRLRQAGIKVFYAPGNHDPYGMNFRLSNIPWPENVHIFTSNSPLSCFLQDENGQELAEIHGAGHEGNRESRNIARDFPAAGGSTPHVGLLHTSVVSAKGAGEHDRYAPCTLKDLETKGYAYWALGHVHAESVLLEKPLIVYPGNLVGRNHREEGLRGAYHVEVSGPDRAYAKFYPLAPVYWKSIKVDALKDAYELGSLEQKIGRAIERELDSSPGRMCLRISLEGPCPLCKELQVQENLETIADALKENFDLEYLELVCDNLVGPVEPEKYKGEPHLLGMALQILDRLSDDDELLLKIAPETLAGVRTGDPAEKAGYLRGLLEGLDYELAARLLEVGRK